MILNDTIKRGRNSHFIWTPQACRNDDLPERSRCRTLGLGKESQRGELEINADSRRAPLLGGRGGLFQSIVGEDPPNSRMWFMSGRVISDKMNKTSAGFHCGAELELIRPQPNPMSNNVSNTESTALTDEPENDAAVHSLLNATLPCLYLSIYLYYPSIYELLLQLIDQWIVKSFQSFNWCFHNACFLSANLKDDPFITTETTSERPGHANMGHKSVSKLVLCQSANWLSSLIDHLITQITAERCMTQTWTRSSTIKTHERCENTLHRFKENSCQSPANFVEKEPGCPKYDRLLSLSAGLCALTQPRSVVCWKCQHLFWELGCFSASFERNPSVHRRIVSSAPDTKYQRAKPVSRSGAHESVGLIPALVITPPHKNRASRLYFNMLASGCTLS